MDLVTYATMSKETDRQLEGLKHRILDRITNVFTSKPTWSAMPFMDHDTYMSIEQAINEEFDKIKKETSVQ